MEKIKSILKNFKSIQLKEMDSVALMHRTDEKYTVNINDIFNILQLLFKTYKCLEIDNERLFNYKTEYLDDNEFNLYKNHQNGKLNRYKIRFRDYIQSKLTFLEIKFKSNKGLTQKKRIKVPFESRNGSPVCNQFIVTNTPYNPNKFDIKLKNSFDRITLVNLTTKERVTIDINLKFRNNESSKDLSELGIIEVKREKGSRKSEILSILKNNRIKPTSFSKYTIGSVLLNPKLKYNKFKKKLLFINKNSANGNIWDTSF